MHNVWTWAPFPVWADKKVEDGVMVAFTGHDGRRKTMVMPRLTVEQFEVRMHWWREAGMNIQDAFPMLNADQREFLMTGLTPEEWDAIFGEEEE